MRIVVTGGAGFIGSNFINHVKEKMECEILCVDKLTYASDIKNIKVDFDLLEKDICEVTPSDLGDYDYLVNFAAETHVDNSIDDGRPFIRSNVEGTFNLLECARRNKNLKKFIQISTDEVYGDMQDLYDKKRFLQASAGEDSPIAPSSYYSASKAASDFLILSANRTFGVPYLITRTCNNFGENQNEEKFLPKILKSIKEDKVIPVYGDGSQVRQWIHVEDNVRIISDLMLNEDAINDVYNITSGIEYKNIEIIKIIGGLLNKEIKYEFVQDRLGHDRAYRIKMNSLNKLHGTLGLNKKLPYSFVDLKDYLREKLK
jgi:dTDP-glucose 4,6-dehydratase